MFNRNVNNYHISTISIVTISITTPISIAYPQYREQEEHKPPNE